MPTYSDFGDTIFSEFNHTKNLLSEIFYLSNKLTDFQVTLSNLNLSLPLFKQESEGIYQQIAHYQSQFNTFMSFLKNYEAQLTDLILTAKENIRICIQKEDTQQELLNEKSKVVSNLINGLHLLQNQCDLYLAKLALSSSNHLGSGFDVIAYENIPKGEAQIQSIEKEHEEIASVLGELKTQFNEIFANTLKCINDNKSKLNEIASELNAFLKEIMALNVKIEELNQLYEIEQSNTLNGFVLKGDLENVLHALSSEINPNTKDTQGNKAIYYACRALQKNILFVLLDCTQLSVSEKKQLIEILPEKDPTIVSAIQHNTHVFDHLWNPKLTLAENIMVLFKDYYSPKIFEDMPILSDQMKRIISVNWDRSDASINLSKSIVTLFNELAQKNDQGLCLALIQGKADDFFKRNTNFFQEQPIESRLNYIIKKLNAVKNLASFASKSDSINPIYNEQVSYGDRTPTVPRQKIFNSNTLFEYFEMRPNRSLEEDEKKVVNFVRSGP